MAVKQNWVLGEQYTHVDQNAIAAAINTAINPMAYGAIGDGVADDTAALTAALTSIIGGGILYLPSGKKFKYTSTITVPSGTFLMGSGRAFDDTGSTGEANLVAGHADALLQIGHYSTLLNIMVDGGGVANWGILAGPGATVKPTMSGVIVHNCVQKGFIFDGVQNAFITDCTASSCGIGWNFYNGCANIELIGCSEDNYGNVGSAGHRAVLIDHDIVETRLGGSVFINGNRDIRFWGGIFEYGTGIHQVDIINGNTTDPGSIEFHGTQLVGNSATTALINVGTGYKFDVVLSDCVVALNTATGKVVTAANGYIKYRNVVTTGSGSRNVPNMTTLTGTAKASYDFATAMLIDSWFQTDLYSHRESGVWAVTGTATATWNTTRKRMAISSPSVGTGNDIYTLWAGSANYAAQYRCIRVRFLLLGASANVRLSTLTGAFVRRNIAAYGNGEHDVVIELQGDEIGLVLSSDNASPVTADVAYITAEHLV